MTVHSRSGPNHSTTMQHTPLENEDDATMSQQPAPQPTPVTGAFDRDPRFDGLSIDQISRIQLENALSILENALSILTL